MTGKDIVVPWKSGSRGRPLAATIKLGDLDQDGGKMIRVRWRSANGEVCFVVSVFSATVLFFDAHNSSVGLLGMMERNPLEGRGECIRSFADTPNGGEPLSNR